jgi:RNA polymerase sigma factor (sigma-70 family)
MAFDEHFATDLSAECARLRRRCISLTGSLEAADDLVQTICAEAWEHRHTLRDLEHLPQWLSAITSNVCKMWLRSEKRQREHIWSPVFQRHVNVEEDAESWVSNFDLEQHLERKELVVLLEGALAHLSPDLRALLIEHYVEEVPGSESARRRGIPLRTAQKRLERGKAAFRHLLQTTLSAELAPYLVNMQAEHWETTRLWCPKCGQHHLQARFTLGRLMQFRCPNCSVKDGVAITTIYTPALIGYQRTLVKMMKWVESYYRGSLQEASRPCPSCGHIMPLLRNEWELVLSCTRCHTLNQNSLDFFALLLEEGRQFWQQHQRIHLLPWSEMYFQGRPALHVSYQALEHHGTYEVFFARDTFEILATS